VALLWLGHAAWGLEASGSSAGQPELGITGGAAGPGWHWGVWVGVLFVLSALIGVISVPAGAGGGVLFVPILIGFFPFHTDFVRGSGILVALATALSASPDLMSAGLVKLRLAIPLALVASSFSIAGVALGFALPAAMLQIALSVVILGAVLVMALARRSEHPVVNAPDAIARALDMVGSYRDGSTGEVVEWRAHRTGWGLAAFSGVGLIAGLFGMGAGWANVPVLNLLMGVPIRLAAATSVFMLSVTDTAAAWGFIHRGAVLPILVAPSLAGVMLGSRLGVVLLRRVAPSSIRKLVMGILLLAGVRSLLKGIGVWP
jgi:hypothetical protein